MKPIDREQHKAGVTYKFWDDTRIEGIFPEGSHCESEITKWFVVLSNMMTLGPFEDFNECLYVIEEHQS